VARHSVCEYVADRYQICGLLGEGDIAEVYRALDTTTGRDVVLKLPHPSIVGEIAALNRYRNEIDIAARLQHPGLQRLLSDPNAPFIVFEYVEGESLRTYLKNHGPLPVDEVLSIGARLADILQYVHEQGIVHRDVKPENVIIGPDGQITLMDFGIALRQASRGFTLSHLTHAVGTRGYMAPEQVRGERGDARTDVYALGVVLYELLTGVVPYPVDDATEAMPEKVETDPPLVRRLRPEVPVPLEAIIYRAIRRRPDERYASMAEMSHDLKHLDDVLLPDKYERDEPPPTPLGDLPPWRTTLPVLAIIFGVLLLAGVAAQLLHRGAAP
jgi:serine/threonine-protein kinase